MSDREALAIPAFDDDLDDFAPRARPESRPLRAGEGQGAPDQTPDPIPAATARRAAPSSGQTRRAVDAVSRFPSREGPADAQLNLKGPREVLERFKTMCRDDRRSYYDMLRILMDAFEGKGRG